MTALTGLLATMPYIALQLVGIEVVLRPWASSGEWPLIIAFLILAAYTYNSGLRAPALIAVVKDTLIYIGDPGGHHLHPAASWAGSDAIFGAASAGDARRRLPDRAPASFIPELSRGARPHTPRWRWARRWRCSCTRT